MRLSYIIPTYNLPPEDIRRCLTSLSQQGLSPADYEVIVVDDESDVSPEPIVREWEQEMNIRFFHQPHARQGAARNLGICQATGDYIRFVDGDDYLPPQTAASMLEMMETHALDVLVFKFKEIAGQASNPSQTRRDKKTGRANLICRRFYSSGKTYMQSQTLFGSPCTLCFRRELLGNPPLRFAENTYIEDEEFVTRLVWRSGPIAITPAVGYIYVQRSDSTVHHPSPEHTEELFRARFKALDSIIRFAQSEPAPHEGIDRKIRYFSIDILRHALRQDNWQQRFPDCTYALHAHGLFPLPKARYSWKYTAFRLLSPYRFGQLLLHFFETSSHRHKL